MFKLPIKSIKKPFVTQYYGDTSNNAWYQAHGINNAFHNGVDLIVGNPVQTYGTPLVAPFDGKVVDVIFDSPMSTKGNGVYYESLSNGSGIKYKIILWHTGEIAVKVGDMKKEGDILCYIGNSGLCNPEKTVESPYSGSHLHFGCYKLVMDNEGQWGYSYDIKHNVMGESDPLLYFSQNQWYLGDNLDAIHDLPPLQWRWTKLGIIDWFSKLIDALRFWR